MAFQSVNFSVFNGSHYVDCVEQALQNVKISVFICLRYLDCVVCMAFIKGLEALQGEFRKSCWMRTNFVVKNRLLPAPIF